MSGTGKDVTDLLRDPPEPPSVFFDLADKSMEGIYTLAAIHASVEIGLFESCEQECTPAGFAGSHGCDPGMIERLCTALESVGLLAETGTGYRNTRISSVFLVSWSPFSQVEYIRKLMRHVTGYWIPLSRILKEGPVMFRSDQFFAELSLPAMAENARCGRLQATVREIMKQPGIARSRKMIDLGGGHGLYAIAMAALLPRLEAYVLDLPYVAAMTERYIREFGMESRVHAIPGNFFTDELGSGYDIVFSSSNPSGKSVPMIGKIADALVPGGLFVNEQASGNWEKNPFLELEWLLWALDGGRKGRGDYTRERPFMTPEYLAGLAAHDLEVVSVTGIADNYHTGHTVDLMIARKRK